MNADIWARSALMRGWPISHMPSQAELQAVQAIGRFEGFYGYADRPEGWKGSNNWGAIHCGHGTPCGADCFEAHDKHADGTVYTTCFRRYETPEAGAAALVHELYRRPQVRAALATGDPYAIARAMRQTGYHETAPEVYGKAIETNARTIAHNCGEMYALRARAAGGDAIALAFVGVLFWPSLRRLVGSTPRRGTKVGKRAR